MKDLNKFRSMIKFGSKDPCGFFISAFIASPSYEVQQFACFPPVVYLGVENLGDFKLGFTVNNDRRWRWLDMIGNGVR